MWKRSCPTAQSVLLDFLVPGLAATRIASPRSRRRSVATSIPSVSNLATTNATVVSKAIRRNDTLNTLDNLEYKTFNSHLMLLEKAIREQDLRAVWRQYCSFEKHDIIHFLGPPQWDRVSRLIDNQCARLNNPAFWPGEEKEIVETLALASAARGVEDGLRALMLLLIRKKDPGTVIDLYKKYVNSVEADQGVLEKNEVIDAIDDGTDDEAYFTLGHSQRWASDLFSRRAGRAEIMLIAIAAHAMLNSFEGALQTTLEQPTIRFVAYSVAELVKELDHDPGLQTKVIAYVQDLSIARLVSMPDKFYRHLTNLSQDRALPQLRKLHTIVMEGLRGPRAWIAPDKQAVSRSKPVVVPDRVWASLVTACLSCRQEDLVEKLWAELLEVGIRPDVSIWNALLEGYREMGSVEQLLGAWEAMKADGTEPNAFSYCAKISALFDGRQKALALLAFSSYQKEFLHNQPSLTVYNAVLHGLLTHSDVEGARAMLTEMKTNGPKPDMVSYNTFLRFHGRKGDLKAMAGVLRDVRATGENMDIVSYTTILSALLKAGKRDVADRLLTIMKSLGVEGNVATYSAIVDHQVRDQTEAGLRIAWDLLAKMEQLPDAKPNEITYTAMLAGIHRNREIDSQQVVHMLKDITWRMEQRGVKPNRVTYHILLKACLDNLKPEGLRSAQAYYREMCRRGIPMSHDTWYIILKGLARRDEWGIANEMVDHMLKSNFEPMWGVLDLVHMIRRQSRKQ